MKLSIADLMGGAYAKIIGAVLSVALIVGGYYLVKDHFQDEAVATVQVDAVKKVDKLEEKASEAEVQLDKKLAKDRKVYEAKKQTVNDRYARDVASVYERPGSSAGNSSTENAGDSKGQAAIAGVQLSRQDEIDLAEFARDSEEMKLGLIQCYSDYDSAKESINNFLKDF
jgi:hypothetical protein